MHPCGVVSFARSHRSLTPTFTSAKGYATTHFDMDAVEQVGLVKMDILAQGGLAVIRDALALLHERGITPDLENLEPWEDAEIWKMIATGNARGVHHIESPAMISLARMCNVRDIDCLIAIVCVIRPGAANGAKKTQFARRAQGLEPVEYAHPSLEPALRSTFGVVAYEEHILQICEAFAGLPAGRADVLRRALVKVKTATIEEIGREFIAAARALGRTDEEIARVWELVAGFQGYAFCRAHSTGLRRRGLPRRVSQAVSPGRVPRVRPEQRQRLLLHARLHARMPAARHRFSSARRERLALELRAGERRHPRAAARGQRPHHRDARTLSARA